MNKSVNLGIKMTADTSGAKQAEAALNKVGDAGKYATQQAQASANQVQKGMQKMGQASLQLQDIAVQAQAGTKAATIAAQQLPQLLSAFGPQGAIIGAAIAGIALIGNALAKSFSGSSEAIKQKIQEDFEEMRKEIVKTQELENEERIDSIERSVDSLDGIKGQQEAIKKVMGEREAAQKRLNALLEEEYKTAVKFLETQGKLKPEQAKEKLTTFEKQKRERKYTLEKFAAQGEVSQLQQAADEATGKVPRIRGMLESESERRGKLKTRLAGLGRVKGSLDTPIAGQAVDKTTPEYQLLMTQIAETEKELEGANNAVNTLAKALKAASDEAAQKIMEASTAEQALPGKLEGISAAQTSEENTAALDEASQAGVDLGTAIKTAIEGLTPVNDEQRAAIERLQKVSSDSNIIASESAETEKALYALRATLTENQKLTFGNVNLLLQQNAALNAKLSAQQKEIQGLSARISAAGL